MAKRLRPGSLPLLAMPDLREIERETFRDQSTHFTTLARILGITEPEERDRFRASLNEGVYNYRRVKQAWLDPEYLRSLEKNLQQVEQTLKKLEELLLFANPFLVHEAMSGPEKRRQRLSERKWLWPSQDLAWEMFAEQQAAHLRLIRSVRQMQDWNRRAQRRLRAWKPAKGRPRSADLERLFVQVLCDVYETIFGERPRISAPRDYDRGEPVTLEGKFLDFAQEVWEVVEPEAKPLTQHQIRKFVYE